MQEERTAPAVLLENVFFKWSKDQKPLLDIPAFTVEPGEQVFIQGSSGTGKSTLLNLIAGILLPQTGTIALNGCKLHTMNSAQRDLYRGDHIGFIFQQFNLIPYLSVLENVLLPVKLSKIRAQRCIKSHGSVVEQAHKLLASVQLDASLWTRPTRMLSVGQQQRVACARALIGQPDLLIADEPTSALDEDRRQIFLELLLTQCTQVNATLLFVSHDRTISDFFKRRIDLKSINRAYRHVA